jgi:hypothetical protein
MLLNISNKIPIPESIFQINEKRNENLKKYKEKKCIQRKKIN